MKQRGFTLIELMIVVAIIGILAMVAYPSYKDYTIRARVIEGLNMAAAAKMAVSESAISNNALPSNQAETGYISPAASENVSSIKVGSGGIITITYTAKAGEGTIIMQPALQPNGDITWTCSGGTLDDRYRPANCR